MDESNFNDIERSFPAGFHSAEAASVGGQRGFKRSSAVALSLLVATAVVGLVESEIAGWLAAFTFSASGILMALAIVKNYELDWYDGRAAAESLKTNAWKFAVGGEPFGADSAEAEESWRTTVRNILKELEQLKSELVLEFSGTPDQRLRQLRESDLALRMEVYMKQRVSNQRDWYSRRAGEHARTVSQIQRLGLALNLAGVALAIGKGLGWIDIDLLSVVAAGVAGLYAWLGVGDYKSVSRSYQFAALELDRVLAEGSGISKEQEWATYVADAEAAMSREHTMWISRRRGS